MDTPPPSHNDWPALLAAFRADPRPTEALEQEMLRRVRRDGQIRLPLRPLLELARQAAPHGVVLASGAWRMLMDQLLPMGEQMARQAGAGGCLAAMTAALALAHGAPAALAWALPVALGHLSDEELVLFAPRLWQAGLWQAPGAVDAAARALVPFHAGATEQETERLCALLALGARPPLRETALLVEHLAIPWMRALAEADKAAAALHLETRLIELWLTREETEAHYARWLALWSPLLRAMGQRRRAVLGPPARCATPSHVAVLVHNTSLLAHVETMLMAQRARQAQGLVQPRLLVCALTGSLPAFRTACEAAGAEVLLLQEAMPHHALTERLEALPEILAARGCGGLIWLCSPLLLSYTLGLGLGVPVAWWSMKFHPPCIEGADMLLAFAGGADPLEPVRMMGREWLAMPAGLAGPVPALPPRRVRQPGEPVVLTTIMREAKLDSPPFWETAIAILRAAPQAVWRYAGRSDLPALRARLEAAGVAERAVFAGWVDPLAECAAADLYLDGWPYTSGLTALHAMLSGLPYVFRNTPMEDAEDGGTPLSVLDLMWRKPRLRGALPPAREAAWQACFRPPDASPGAPSLLRWPDSQDEQVNWALDLIADATLRRQTGEAFRRFATENTTDPAPMGKALDLAMRRLLARAPAPCPASADA